MSGIGQGRASRGSFFAVRGSHGQPIVLKSKSIKKSVGARTLAYPAILGSRIAHLSRISNARSPRWIIYTQIVGIIQTQHQHRIYESHERESLPYLATSVLNLRDSRWPQIKRQFDAVLICLSPLYIIRGMTVQSYIVFPSIRRFFEK